MSFDPPSYTSREQARTARGTRWQPSALLLAQIRYRVAAGEPAAAVLRSLAVTHPPHVRAYLAAL